MINKSLSSGVHVVQLNKISLALNSDKDNFLVNEIDQYTHEWSHWYRMFQKKNIIQVKFELVLVP